MLDQVRETLERVAEVVGPRVTGVGHRWGLGSGVVVGPERLLTNAHNIRGEEVVVTFADGRSASGRPLGVDVDGDLAVIEVETGSTEPVEWSEDEPLAIGTPVIALANPGGRGLRVTLGYVSGLERSFRGPAGRRIGGSFEHTAPLLPGSSGGPVVDPAGRLLGINTNRLGSGFYLALPAGPDLRRRVEALAEGSVPERPRLGVGLAPPHVGRRLRRAVGLPEVEGLLVRVVEEDGPAAEAGVSRGDLIVAAGGEAVSEVEDLYRALEAADGSVELRLLRGTEERTITVDLARSGPRGG